MDCRTLVAVLVEDMVAVLAEEEDAVQVLCRAWKEHVLAEGQAEVMVAPEAWAHKLNTPPFKPSSTPPAHL